ncbi:MAG: hypothetical protein ACFFBL_00030 [Promethearchaeota archaeon]
MREAHTMAFLLGGGSPQGSGHIQTPPLDPWNLYVIQLTELAKTNIGVLKLTAS